MFFCNDCGAIFEEPEYERVCWEDYYGVSSMFNNYNYGDVEVCPECTSEDIEEYYGEEN